MLKRQTSGAKKPPRKTKDIEEALSVIRIEKEAVPVEPIDGEEYRDALRYAVREMHAKGFTAREIARECGKKTQTIWEIINEQDAEIDRMMTSKDAHKRNQIRRAEMLIKKYFPVAVAERYEMTRYTKDGIPYVDDNAIDVQMQAFNVVMKAEERLAKLVGFDDGDDEKNKVGISIDHFLELARRIPAIPPIPMGESHPPEIKRTEAIEIAPIEPE